MTVILLDDAETDIEAAYDFYEQQRPGLGNRFLTAFQRTVGYIRRFPRGYGRVFKSIRLCSLGRFPYGVFYSVRRTVIVIHAVIHLARSQSYWQRRLSED